jgi:hypothetical protein
VIRGPGRAATPGIIANRSRGRALGIPWVQCCEPVLEGKGLPVADAESFTLKPISASAIPQALEKAVRYRLLNEPEQAESICLDILAAAPDNQEAIVVLILSITDRFGRHGNPGVGAARRYVARLTDPYKRHYYEGLVREREARACLDRPMGSGFAYDGFRAAMACYERATAIRPRDDEDAILRWNACVRTIQRADLRPRPPEVEQPLE